MNDTIFLTKLGSYWDWRKKNMNVLYIVCWAILACILVIYSLFKKKIMPVAEKYISQKAVNHVFIALLYALGVFGVLVA